MKIMDIIKESSIFPSNDVEKLIIYVILSIISVILAASGAIISFIALIDSSLYAIVGIILSIVALIIFFILSGYQISIIKSGIEHDESLPEFNWKDNLITGIKYLVVMIVYLIIPAAITLIVALLTNVPGNIYSIFNHVMTTYANANVTANTTMPLSSIPAALLNNLAYSLAITAIVGVVLFVLFGLIQIMAESRLAKTDRLGDALNVIEAFKDIGRIGWGKVVGTAVLIFVIIFLINMIISLISQYVNIVGILSIIVTPYLTFFAARATGLLYSEIA